MSSLKEAIAARRTTESAINASSFAADAVPRPFLQIEPGACERWLLAWSQFISARYDERAGQEELILQFAEHEVIVHGRRLARLFADTKSTCLSCIRQQPQPDMAAVSDGEPVVTAVQIHALSRSGRTPET